MARFTVRIKRPRSVSPLLAKKRRAVITLEFILCLPVLVITLLAAVQYGSAMIVRQAVSHAASEGAREAGKRADALDVVAKVQSILAPHQIVISNAPGSGVRVLVEDGIQPPQFFGDPNVAAIPTGIAPNASEARVTVSLNLTTAPLSNWLAVYGVDFAGKRFQVSSLVQKQ